MVVFKKHVKESSAKEHHDWVQSIHTKKSNERMELRKRSQFPVTTEIFDGLKHTYNIIGGMVGYSGHFDEETIEAIRRHPDVSRFPFTQLGCGGVQTSLLRCAARGARTAAVAWSPTKLRAAPQERHLTLAVHLHLKAVQMADTEL